MAELQKETEKDNRPRWLLPRGRWLVTVLGVAALFLLTGFLVGQVAGANSGVPGSEQDPLVTKSWVEARLDAFNPNGVARPPTARPDEPVRIVDLAPVYTVVVVEAGKKMFPGEGTELILRSGRAKAMVPVEGNGLANLTTGRNLEDGDPIERDHLILCPREDGRGILTETETIFLVRSKYRIV